ncbi:MAG: rod shape-determining protein, partial [Thermodesulfobacteriota bacterium]|nr:rod shape-determining protein [Thermodesulfobacteriota bacterium]
MFLSKILDIFSKDLAMDLGTANTLIYQKGKGIVLNEPSVVALTADTRKIVAVGQEAKEFLGRTPKKIEAIRPMKDGVIADFNVTQEMIKFFLTKVQGPRRLIRPRIVIGVPTGITQVEKRAVIEAAQMAGAREVHLVDEPMAAAIGAGINVHVPQGRIIVDIGGGTTEVAVISLSAIAYSESIRVAGDETNDAIMRYMQKKHQLLIGENTAEKVKMTIGNAFPPETPAMLDIRGKQMLTGKPQVITVNSDEMREALAEPVQAIIETVRRALEKTPPELSADIYDSGIILAGGGALLQGLDQLIARE